MKYRNTTTGKTTNERILELQFEETLDDIHAPCIINGSTYYAGQILKKVAPIHFRCAFLDWLDASDWEEADE